MADATPRQAPLHRLRCREYVSHGGYCLRPAAEMVGPLPMCFAHAVARRGA